MWLPMEFTLSRNHTYDKIRSGKLSNIRLNTVRWVLRDVQPHLVVVAV